MNLFDRFVAAFFACMEVSMNVFEAVRENGITARQAAEHCGIKINRSGMAVCPFHKDKNPSMKIDSRYYCFGCGEKGDAIDFVAKYYGLGKKEAALQIASDFGISFEDNRGRKPPPKRKRKLSPEQRFERAEKKCFRVLSDYLCCLRQWKELVLVYKCGQEKLNNLYYQMKEQRRCSTWRKIKNLTLRNLNSRSWICIMPEELRIHNWNVNMA